MSASYRVKTVVAQATAKKSSLPMVAGLRKDDDFIWK